MSPVQDLLINQKKDRVLLVACILFFSSVFTLAAMFIYVEFFTPGERTGLCGYESPRAITTKVAGIEGPAVREGRAVVERAQRCVEGAAVINVYAYRYFERVGPDGLPISGQRRITDLSGLPQPRVRGNNYTDVSIQLPPEVTQGRWRLSGADIAIETGDVKTWFSEPFTVVP